MSVDGNTAGTCLLLCVSKTRRSDRCGFGRQEARCGAEWTCRRDTGQSVGYSCGCDKKPGWKSVSGEPG